MWTNYLDGSEYCYTLVKDKIFHMDIDSSALRSKLKEFFGFDSFKGDQERIIRHLVSGGSAFVIMPTGGGKSMCYQLPALVMEGTAIVISPLIALMKNQVDAIRGFVSGNEGIAHFLNSSLSRVQLAEVKEDLLSGTTKLLYVAPESLTKPENIALLKEIRVGAINRSFIPFLCGASRRNMGVQPLIDAIVDFLPAPDEIPAAKGFHTKKEEEVSIPCKEDGTPLGLVFKIQYDREAGSLCYVRMYSGKIKTGDQVYNIGKKKRERVNRILRMHSNKSEPMDSVSAGDIAVIIGLKLAQTGDTIGSEGMPVLLEKMNFPEPVISVAVEPATLSDRDKLKETLEILSKEDPTFTSREDAETGQLIISGMGELHLDVLVTRMLEDFKVEARVGSPQVTYRESVTGSADHTETYSRVLGGKENTAEVTRRYFNLTKYVRPCLSRVIKSSLQH